MNKPTGHAAEKKAMSQWSTTTAPGLTHGLTWTGDDTGIAVYGRDFTLHVACIGNGAMWSATAVVTGGGGLYQASRSGFNSPALAQAWAADALSALRGVAERLS